MPERVLLIDDDGDFLDSLAERLRLRGMEVSTTTSPKDALLMIEKESFDAIILDFQMPEMDGMATLMEMKKKKPDLQVIFLTGHATVERGVEALKSGAKDFVEKPIDLESLAGKIKEAKAEKMLLVDRHLEDRIKKILEEKGW